MQIKIKNRFNEQKIVQPNLKIIQMNLKNDLKKNLNKFMSLNKI